MRFTISFVFVILTFFIYLNASAQSKSGAVFGNLKESGTQSSLPGTVYLLKAADSAMVKGGITDSSGHFIFNNIANGLYLVKATCLGYRISITGPFQINDFIPKNIGNILLTKSTTNLTGVTIKATKPLVEMRAGKIILNVQNSALSVGNSAFEILKNAPGVQIDNDNTIKLNGKTNVLVLVNNKPTNLSADALAELLSSTPGSTVSQVELISNPGASYDAAGTGGIININLKKNENFGTNGSFFCNSGVQQLTQNHSAEAVWGAGISFNHRTRLLDIYSNYAFTNNPLNRIINTDRFISYNNQVNELINDFFWNQRVKSNIYRLGIDINVDKSNIIGLLLSGTNNSIDINKDNVTRFYQQSIPDSVIITGSKYNGGSSNIGLDLNYKSVFNSWGELSTDFDFSGFNRHRFENIHSYYYYTSTIANPYKSLMIGNNYPSSKRVAIFNTNFKINVGINAVIHTIVKYSYVKTNSVSDFRDSTNGIFQQNVLFTNNFNYTEKVGALAVIFDKKINEKLTLNLGLRAEQTIANGLATNFIGLSASVTTENYTDIFPSIQITNSVNKDNLLYLSIGRRIRRPELEDLNPYISYIDQYSYFKGNPALKPYYTNNLELSHRYKSLFTTTLRFSIVHNFLQAIYNQNDTTKVIITSKVNLGTRYTYGLQYNLQLDMARWWNVNFNLDASYQRFTSTLPNTSLNNQSQDVVLGIKQQFKLFNEVTAELNGNYETPTAFGIFTYKSEYFLNAAFSKNLFKRKATVRFAVYDIFNTDSYRYNSNFNNLDIKGYQKNGFRNLQLSFSYNFGSVTVKNERKRSTGAEDEESRAAASGN